MFVALLITGACGSKPGPTTTTPTGSGSAGSGSAVEAGSGAAAKEGEVCGDGTMGRPNTACAEGLHCDMSDASATPAGAEGSAPLGHCKS